MSVEHSGIDQLLKLDVKMDKICNSLELFKEKQDLIAADIAKIKEAVYNPDNGLYARLRQLEAWRSTSSKLIWTLFSSVIGLLSAFIIKNFP